jgi:hypothetical protein
MLILRTNLAACSIGWSAGCHGHDVYGRPVDDEGISLAHELVPAAKTAGFLMNPEIVIFFRLHATERTSTMHSRR